MKRHSHLLPNPPDYLLPEERTWSAVWRTFRMREAIAALLAFVLVLALSLAWGECGQSGLQAPSEEQARVGAGRGGGAGDHAGRVAGAREEAK